MPATPTILRLDRALTAPDVVNALTEERDYANSGVPFNVTSATWEGDAMVIGVERLKGRRAVAIEEALEGSRAIWGPRLENKGEVFVANSDTGEIALRFTRGPLPAHGERILLYQRDYLTPLIELWSSPVYARRAMRATSVKAVEQIYASKPLPEAYSGLRERQQQALLASLSKLALIVGPPGTGKTYTIGALISYLLSRFKDSRILLVGPTNVSVDSALLSADDWLTDLGRPKLKQFMKRIGSRFDIKKFRDRPYLLAPGIADTALQVAMLELDEPSRSDIVRYIEWKELLDRARSALKTDVHSVAKSSRLVAVTTASLFTWHDLIRAAGPWHFLVCDEASQVFSPGALMLTTFAKQSAFAGDPNQLSPIVQSNSPNTYSVLAVTAFQSIKGAKRVQLNEQSRMTHAICDAVATTFYDGDLIVCRKTEKDAKWKAARSAYFVNGREVPRLMFDDRAGDPTWSPKYNGLIRYSSAKLVEAYVAEFLGSYADAGDILVLTPFRAQRALLRAIFRSDSLRDVRVSTVHKAQGSESKIVIFDPVDASKPFLNSDDGMRLINVALSRAQAHAVFVANPRDLVNPWMRQLHSRSRALWHKKGDYASIFFVNART
jgi:hypothetical protein